MQIHHCIQNHQFTYDEKIKVESVTQAVCDLALRFGESADGEESIMVRFYEKILTRYGFWKAVFYWSNRILFHMEL